MTEEILKQAKQIGEDIKRITYINGILQNNDNVSDQRLSLNFKKEIGRDRFCIKYECFSIDIEDFFTKEELAEKVNHRISELQKELDSL